MSAAPESKEQEPTQNDIDRGKQTGASIPKPDPTSTLESEPNKKLSKKEADDKKKKEEDTAKLRAALDATDEGKELSGKLQIIEFILITGFGILTILAIGAIIFYLLDWAASIFDFDLSEYTQWLILILSGINIIMSCCGCYGTYKLSDVGEQNEKRLKEAIKILEIIVKDFEQDNKQLDHTLGKFQVEIDHLNNENSEAIASLRNVEKREKDFIRERKNEASMFVSLRELWNLWKSFETFSTIARITSITAKYYKYSYIDDDIQPGLDSEQYNYLLRSITKSERKFFPPFNHKVWRKHTNNNSILVDEFERVLVLIYKNVLRDELKVKLSNKDRSRNIGALGVTKEVLDQQNNKKKKGIFDKFFGR
eukprot:439182_1